MNRSVDERKKVLFGILVAFACVAVINGLKTIVVAVLRTDTSMVAMLISIMIALVLTGIFLALLKLAYEGKNWARYTVILIGMCAGSMSILFLFMTIINVFTFVFYLLSFIVFFIGTLILIISNDIRAYYALEKKIK